MVVRQQSLVELAVMELQKLIYAGKYLPGQRLREEQLSERLGISRPPLREALRILTQRGIIEQLPRRGVRVVSLSKQEILEIYSLREALERFAVELAFPNPDPQGVTVMRQALVVMEQAAQMKDHGQIVQSNRDFHVALIKLASHKRLLQTYIGLMDQMQLCMSENLRTENTTAGDYIDGVQRHIALLEAIEEGDLNHVLSALASHGARGPNSKPSQTYYYSPGSDPMSFIEINKI